MESPKGGTLLFVRFLKVGTCCISVKTYYVFQRNMVNTVTLIKPIPCEIVWFYYVVTLLLLHIFESYNEFFTVQNAKYVI